MQNDKNYPLTTFLTISMIAIFLTIPNICYIIYKNVRQATLQYCFVPQITVYLDRTLDDDAVSKVISQIQADHGVEKVLHLSSKEVLSEFCNCSEFNSTVEFLEEKPLSSIALVIPKLNFHKTNSPRNLYDRISHINGIEVVFMDERWFVHFALLIRMIRQFSMLIGVSIIIELSLLITNKIYLDIIAYRDTINVQNLISLTNVFIFRSFFYLGALLGFSGALLSLILSEMIVMKFSPIIINTAQVIGINLDINGLSFNECLLLLLVCSMCGWIAAWLATMQYLHHFTLDSRRV